MFLSSSLEALRNVRYDAAQLRLEARVGTRSLPIVGGMWSNLKLFVNNASAIVRVPAAFFFGAEHREPPAMPELPEVFKDGPGKELGTNLSETFQRDVAVADAKCKSMQGLVGLNITQYQQYKSIAANAQARQHVSLPEDAPTTRQALGAGVLGGLVPSIANAASGAMQRA